MLTPSMSNGSAVRRGCSAFSDFVWTAILSSHLIRRELQSAFDLANQIVSLVDRVQDFGLLVEAHLAQGNSLFLFGKLTPALENKERAIGHYDHHRDRDQAFLYGLDSGVFCLARAAWIRALLGHNDQASREMDEVLTLAHEPSHALLSRRFDLRGQCP
jgi:hypothetical protein